MVANLAKGGVGGEVIGNQVGDDYPSFTVRLSFVIGSFKVGKRQEIGGERVGCNGLIIR